MVLDRPQQQISSTGPSSSSPPNSTRRVWNTFCGPSRGSVLAPEAGSPSYVVAWQARRSAGQQASRRGMDSGGYRRLLQQLSYLEPKTVSCAALGTTRRATLASRRLPSTIYIACAWSGPTEEKVPSHPNAAKPYHHLRGGWMEEPQFHFKLMAMTLTSSRI